MNIEEYEFGRLVIDGQTYTSDLMICGGEIYKEWWRQEGHSLGMDDLKWILLRKPEVLIIGKGNVGCMEVPAEIVDELQHRGIQVQVANTGPAIELYSEIVEKDNRKVGAGFHLTC